MPPFDPKQLPFLTRNMLAFEQGAVFGLRITTQASTAGPLTIRGMTREGAFTLNHTTVGDGSVQTQTFNLPDIPTWVTVADESDSYYQGNAFVTLSLVYNGTIIYQMGSSFVYFPVTLSWPSVNRTDMNMNHGAFTVTSSPNPAAGSEITYTVPSGFTMRILSLTFTLVNAATAGNRRPHVVFTQTGNKIVDCFSSIDQIISENKKYTVASFGAVTDETDDNDIVIPMPHDIWLNANDTITTETTNLAAGDNYSDMVISVERFFRTA